MKLITNKWLWLAVFVVGWNIAGVVGFRDDTPPAGTGRDDCPRRIVAMAPSLTEILFALGLQDNIVGVTEYSNHPPAARQKPVMGTFWQPNIEAVVAAAPDLIITLGFDRQAGLAHRLARLNFNTFTVPPRHVRSANACGTTLPVSPVASPTEEGSKFSISYRSNLCVSPAGRPS